MAIFIGIGANIPGPYGGPQVSCEMALQHLDDKKIHVDAVSSWWESEPVPKSDQDWYVNGVARVMTHLPPRDLLAALHDIETILGRVRASLNEPRCIDLDLLAYDETCCVPGPHTDSGPHIPHPRLHERTFVLLPLKEVCPRWNHPRLQKSVSELLEDLSTATLCRKIHPITP